MLEVQNVDFKIAPPVPDFETWTLWAYALFFALILAIVDVIEQVMSNAAIEKIDPLERPCNSNNSLLSIWVANMGSSLFGGMTNLDGLAKSSTNRLAGAYTKLSVLVIGVLITFFIFNSQYLSHLPYFALAIIMVFVGMKMILGLLHVAKHGEYALLLGTLCGLLVFQVGIFEGLLITLALHEIIHFVIFTFIEKMDPKRFIKKYFERFKDDDIKMS